MLVVDGQGRGAKWRNVVVFGEVEDAQLVVLLEQRLRTEKLRKRSFIRQQEDIRKKKESRKKYRYREIEVEQRMIHRPDFIFLPRPDQLAYLIYYSLSK